MGINILNSTEKGAAAVEGLRREGFEFSSHVCLMMSSRRSEALAFSLVTGINLAMARLVDIWDSIGILEDQRVERMETVKKHIEGLLNDMITEEEALKERIEVNIISFQRQLESLYQEMSLEPYKVEEGLTVLQMEKNLRLRVEALLKEKNDRLKEMRNLKQQDEELCEELCATPYYIPTGSLPSRAQLQEFRQHIKRLTEEKNTRVKVFTGLREDIGRLMAEMGHEPETSLERESVCNEADVFLLTHENIKALKLLLCQLQVKKESLLSTQAELKERVASLWNRLDSPEEEQREFRGNLQGTLSDQIAQWQNEVDRLELLQKAKLEDVIIKIRQELVETWDKCLFGPEQRAAFNSPFCDSNFTEELLAQHEEELVRVKACYEKARPLLDTMEKWERTWALFQDFEKKALDPNRFSNRGGALLKEAKERVKVQKMLPKLEEELKVGVEEWEQREGSAFLVRGLRAMDYISGLWEEHRLQRDKEKSDRITKKGEGTPFKTPTKRPLRVDITPSKAKKMPNQTVLRSTSSSSSTSSTLLNVSGKPPVNSQKAQQRNKGLENSHRTPLQEFNSEKKHLRIGSYSEFTSELSRKASHDAILNSTAKDIL
ncbi:protein regulator of cytokinesis 1 isoform X1 [Scleropages formosus]|nr:protein regulator of cytokinesis 1-like isoform X1 [Scleropages formosus]